MDFAGQRVTVMGLGRFGGGVGVARYLVKQGADVLVTDLLAEDELADSLAQLAGLPIEYRLGEHNVSDFTTCDRVVANPAVKPDNRFLRAAHAASVPVTSEIRLLVAALPNRLRTIGVTGTAGKSTVTAMIGHILKKFYPQPPDPPGDQSTETTPHVWVGGNLGGSLLDHLDQINQDDWVVLELSSFMLHGLREGKSFPGWSPHIAVVTNITPNHLDWHGSFEDYIAAKRSIIEFQVDGDKSVMTAQAREVLDIAESSNSLTAGVLPVPSLAIPGAHNEINARCSALACIEAGEYEVGLRHLVGFPGLPHRLEFVLEDQGVRYFNDSKCTTPQAAELAIKSFEPGSVHIILGGYDKGSDLTGLARYAAAHCAGLYTIGATGCVIAAVAETAAQAASAGAGVIRCGELDVAVREAVKRATGGQVVLLSPACASWDQFVNYEQRGEKFINLVNRQAG